MINKSISRNILVSLVFVSLTSAAALAQTTAFTYQGKLSDGGNPANGAYDLQGKLFDTATVGTGAQQGATVTVSNVTVTAGVFTVQLDFGAGVFSGAPRFLEIAVKPISGGTFTVLGPRQPVASTPYAIKSANSAAADSLSAACMGCVTSNQIQSLPTGSGEYIQNTTSPQAASNFNISGDGLIGGSLALGTPTPFAGYKLDVNGESLFRTGGSGGGFISLHAPNSETGLTINGMGTTRADLRFDGFTLKLVASAAGIPQATSGLVISTSGSVGIGIASASLYKLHVSSDTEGIRGDSNHNTGVTGTSIDGEGVYGLSINGSGVFGTVGFSGIQPYEPTGVWGDAVSNIGVFGSSRDYVGVFGSSRDYTGVFGSSTSHFGVYGKSTTLSGVYGETNASTLGAAGVFGRGSGSGSIGVIGEGNIANAVGVYGASTSSTGFGMFARNQNGGYAGYFDGNVFVNGTINKSAVGFKIDHPLDPANKYLYHSGIESPDMQNLYNGNLTTDEHGEATVTLPEWFEALNRDFRYQLTVIGVFAQAIVAYKIKNNRFTIKTDKPQVEVSWQVTGIRQDAYANAHRMPIEEEKTEKERGYYLRPELFEQPEEKSIEWARDPIRMKQQKEEREKAPREQENKAAAPAARPNHR